MPAPELQQCGNMTSKNIKPVNLDSVVVRSISSQGVDMAGNIQPCLFTRWVNGHALHGFSKNPSMPGLRYRSWQGYRPLPASDASPDKLGFPDNSMPNCGF
jgi:hypothetical protein